MSCAFDSAIAVRLVILSILPSLLDLSTDILNAVDMILSSQGICFECKTEFFKSLINICKGASCQVVDLGSSALAKPTMGYISVTIIFLPGIVKAFYHVVTCLTKEEYRKVPMAFCYLPFPLYILYIQGKAVLSPLNAVAEQKLIRALSMEAFYESFPQLVLQIISIIYSYHLSYIQAVSIAFSLLMLAKTVILLDSAETIRVANNDEKEFSGDEGMKEILLLKSPPNEGDDNENSGENAVANVSQKDQETGRNKASRYCTTACSALLSALGYMLWVLPLYLTSIIFKIAAFSITIAYLRVFALLTMGLLIIELFVLAKYTGFTKFADQIYPVFSNFFIVNIGGAQIPQKEVLNKEELKQHSTNYENMYKFAKRSVTLSYIHHTLVLILIALLVMNVGKIDEPRKPIMANGTVNGTIITQEFNCSDTVSCAKNVVQSTIADLRIHWVEMHEWLYPYCKYRNCGLKMEDKKFVDIKEFSKKYPFMITITSVIVVGLINQILSTYSARDIKEKNKEQLGETKDYDEEMDERRLEVKCSNVNELSDANRLIRDADINGFISIENNEVVFKINLSNVSEYGFSKQGIKDVSEVCTSLCIKLIMVNNRSFNSI